MFARLSHVESSYSTLYRFIIAEEIANSKQERRKKRLWSGKRDSNPRPLPWQGNALPAELFPQIIMLKGIIERAFVNFL